MTVTTAPSIYENFNARNLSAREVARTFIPSSNFSTLLAKNHTLIVGPRGSGKTTLLKMCQQEALDSWNHEQAASFLKKVDFTGVYVPTDVSWGRQIRSLGEGKLDEVDREIFAVAAFSTNVLHTIVETMAYRAIARPQGCERSSVLTEDNEADLVDFICDAFILPRRLSTLDSVKQHLKLRLNTIHTMASQESRRTETGRTERIAEVDFLHLSFLTAVSAAIEVFNDKLNEKHQRWALLFDELELAPPAITKTLIRSLRSVDERILFKLSLAPFCEGMTSIEGALAATPGNDYQTIALWYSHKKDGKPFCQELWSGLIRAAELPGCAAEKVFGDSILTTATDEWSESEFKTAYRPKSKRTKIMSDLAAKDASFQAFLDDKKINLSNLTSLSSDRRATTVRKAMGLVALRNELLDTDGHLRSRKSLPLYSGADALFAIVEGNPRWFKGIVGGLVQASISDVPLKISAAKQAGQIRKAVARFFALLRTIPLGLGSTKSLPDLLNTIGRFLSKAQVQKPFTLDPPGRFKVDLAARDGLVSSLGQALNAGAIISMSKSGDEGTHHAIRGQEFRLCYLLAVHYKLLLRTGRSLSLHGILNEARDQELPSLFEDIEDDSHEC